MQRPSNNLYRVQRSLCSWAVCACVSLHLDGVLVQRVRVEGDGALELLANNLSVEGGQSGERGEAKEGRESEGEQRGGSKKERRRGGEKERWREGEEGRVVGKIVCIIVNRREQ